MTHVPPLAVVGSWHVDPLRNYIQNQKPGVEALIVGGAVRDFMRQGFILHDDVDVEVFGCSYEELEKWLYRAVIDLPELQITSVNTVGKAFGVVKVRCAVGELDFSIPRRDSRNAGVGHTAFDVTFDPTITREEAAKRRDFTMNSMFIDTKGKIHDPFGGVLDIDARRLRATSNAFMEDPLRVLRGMQFASRFGMEMELHTLAKSREMAKEYHSLSKDRIWGEWRKWALGPYPSKGLHLLVQTDWIDLYPELEKLIGCPQDPEWHPEGDVWQHTLYVCDAMGSYPVANQDDKVILMFACLLHDVGKPYVNQNVDGRWRSPGHAEAGVPLAEDFLFSIGAPRHIVDHVKPLVKEHMVHIGTQPTDRVIRRLSRRLEPSNIPMLRRVVFADMAGRPPLPAEDLLSPWVNRAIDLQADQQKPQRLLMGRHLIQMEIEPGRLMGRILEDAYEAQLDGEFTTVEGAMTWAAEKLEGYLR